MLVFCRDEIISVATNMFVATKHVFCCDKTRLLSRQNCKYFCHDKRHFVATKDVFCHWHKKFCLGEHTFVVTKDVTKIIFVAAPANDTNPALKQMAPQFVCDYVKHVGLAHVFVTTKLVTWRAYFCHFKRLVARKVSLSRQKFCRDKSFVATNIHLVATKDVFCRDKHVCRDKTFVAT